MTLSTIVIAAAVFFGCCSIGSAIGGALAEIAKSLDAIRESWEIHHDTEGGF